MTVRGSDEDSADGLKPPLAVHMSSSVDSVSVWTVRAVMLADDGSELAGSEVECEGLVGCSGVVHLSGLNGGQRYTVRGRVWRGGRESVSLWSCGVEVQMVTTSWLPRAQQLPAMDLNVDVGALQWSEPVAIDTEGWFWKPSVAALDDDRLLVAWPRGSSGYQSHSSCTAVGLVAGPHRRHWTLRI